MVKNEQLKRVDQLKPLLSVTSTASLTETLPMFQEKSIVVPQRSIDSHAIDISSIKGRFAWEKIAVSDTYMPVIFRGTTKYFCVKMVLTLLPGYSEDVIRHTRYYNYRKKIELYKATPNEIQLLNRINSHHSHWEYTQQPFTAFAELVCVLDFIPFLEYLRFYSKSQSLSRSTTTNSVRQMLSQPQQSMQSSPDVMNTMPSSARVQSTRSFATAPVPTPSHPILESTHEDNFSTSRPVVPVTPVRRPARNPNYNAYPLVPPKQGPQCSSIPQQQQQLLSAAIQRSVVASPNSTINITSAVLPKKRSTDPPTLSGTLPATPINTISSSPSHPTASVFRALSSHKSPSTLSQRQSSSSPSKVSSPHCGWLQINKLYTPYISTSSLNRQLYRIPVSLLTFYELLKMPLSEFDTNESRDSSSNSSFEQTLATSYELELINELCSKQNIKSFPNDTKLIDLSTFYRYSSANILFIKELPLNEPKMSICKEWSSIVQINGGICRLRNTTTLHEQTVPFIGHNLLKNFILSSQCSSTASLTIPTTAELEFLQLLLFFTDMSVNLRNAKLIDIESVKREYNVDLILLFNDKFPSNVLNYQQQGSRLILSQTPMLPSNSSTATNTIAESTPPPSPPSPANNRTPPTTNTITVNPSAQLPLTSSSTLSNRYQKTVSFHGRSMVAYICSGLGSTVQRECVSVKELCHILHPNSIILDKVESKLLRVLRSKNINRFRPQSQQAVGLTRLIDIKDAEIHWDYIEQEMRSISANDEETNVVSVIMSSTKASTSDLVEKNIEHFERSYAIPEASIDVQQGVKRPLDESPERALNEDDVPVQERLDKRVRFLANEVCSLSASERFPSTKSSNDDNESSYDNELEKEAEDDNNKKIRLESDDDQHTQLKIDRNITRQSPSKVPHRKIRLQKTKRLLKTPKEQPLVLPKKRIFLAETRRKMAKKRPRPCTRVNQQSAASWVEKYDIEECWISLNLYDPIYDTETD